MEIDLEFDFKGMAESMAERDMENILNKPTRYSKDVEYLKSLIPVDIYETLDKKIKDVQGTGIKNYKHGKSLYKTMKVVYDDFTFDIVFEETFMRSDCRLLISIESPFEIGFDRIDDEEEYNYIIKKKAEVFYNEFAIRFNHMMIKVLNNIKEGCNKELDNTIRFDLGTGIGKNPYANRPYCLLEKKIISPENDNVNHSQNLFGNGYYYVSFSYNRENEIPYYNLKQLKIEEDVIKSYFIFINYIGGAAAEHISPENPYLQQMLSIMKKLVLISKKENINICLNTKVSSVDIILEEDDEKVITLKDLMESKKLDIEDFKLLHQIINNTKGSYQEEFKTCILSKRMRKGAAYYPYVEKIYISERLHDEESIEGNRTKGGKKIEIILKKREF